jgi:hypothetical protein
LRVRIDGDGDRAIAAGLLRTDLGGLMEEEGHAERVDRAHRPVRPPVLGEHAVTRGRGGEGVGDDDLCVGTELREVALDELWERVRAEAEIAQLVAIGRPALGEAIEDQRIETSSGWGQASDAIGRPPGIAEDIRDRRCL